MAEQRIVYFKNFDSIRFIAACIVFLTHAIVPYIDLLNIDNPLRVKVIKITLGEGIGVPVFFVLSGFLITYLLIDEYKRNLKINLKAFYMRRILRIWPLYFAIILFSFALYPYLLELFSEKNPLQSNIFYYLTFLSNFDSIRVHQENLTYALSQDITWSVAIEEQFYLFWPIIFLLPKRAWIYIITIILAYSLIFRLIVTNSVVIYFHTISAFAYLCMGGLFAYLISYNIKVKSIFENTNTNFQYITITLLFVTLVLFQLVSFKYFHSFIYSFSLSFIVAIFITSQAISKKSKFLLSNFSIANFWGKYSYGIYLLHPIAIKITSIFFNKVSFNKLVFLNYLFMAVISFIFTLILSYISYEFYEKKFLKLKMYFKQ